MFMFLWFVLMMLFLCLYAVMPVPLRLGGTPGCMMGGVFFNARPLLCFVLGGVCFKSRPSLSCFVLGGVFFNAQPSLVCFTFFVGVCGTPKLCMHNDAAFQWFFLFLELSTLKGAMAEIKSSFVGYELLTSFEDTKTLPRKLECLLRGHLMPVSKPWTTIQ